ncbi:hypothetical protein K438DRAFT_1978407 [Mycena galopus ATCC 62051]|nr:hypothetical protein K438DRAFT_1978407 [Mycena galopus ATCC 62051]
MYQAKPVEIQTSNFGGSQGTLFNDKQDASGFPNSAGNVFIDPQHPIQQMDIYAGWCVDAITTTYRLSDDSTKVIKRGSSVSGSENLTSVELNDGQFFSVSNPLALAGYQTAGSAQIGISGLSIIKSNMVE